MSCAVYFNLDGTLTEHDIDYEQVYATAVAEAGLESLADANDTYTESFFDYFQDGWAYPRRQAMQQLMADNDIDDLGQSDAFATAWENAEHAQTTFRDGARDAVERAAQTHDVGILSNGTGRLQRKKLDAAGITDLLDALLISSEVGIVKPDPAIFAVARDAIQADTHVLISQDVRRDLAPAKQQGFHTVWLSEAEMNEQLQQIVDAQAATLDEAVDAADQLCNQ